MTERKERPILFNGEMVRAILDGRKTQTRRVVKPRPEGRGRILRWQHDHQGGWTPDCGPGSDPSDTWRCPYGEPGDLLWARETWRPLLAGSVSSFFEACDLVEDASSIQYRADDEVWFHGEKKDGTPLRWHVASATVENGGRWRPSIHMPRWASRITLEVTEARVERVQDISEEDARAEGVSLEVPGLTHTSARRAFTDLWDSINDERGFGWNANPWVWVVGIKPVEARRG